MGSFVKTEKPASSKGSFVAVTEAGKKFASTPVSVKTNTTPVETAVQPKVETGKGWVSTGAGRKSTVGNYDSALNKLEEQRRQAQVDLDTNAVARIDKEIESLNKSFGKKDFSESEFVANTVKQGISDIAQAGGNTFAFIEKNTAGRLMELLTGDSEIYKTLPFYTLNEGVKRDAAALDEQTRANTEAGGKAAQIAETVGAGAIAALPQLYAAMASGGTSIAANGLAATSAAAQASPTLMNSLKTVSAQTAKNPQFWLSFFNSVGNDYESAKANGSSETRATLYALGTSLMNAAVETSGGIQALPAELQGGKSAFRAWLDTAMDEGREGAVQGVLSRAMEVVALGKDNPVFSLTNESAVLNPITIGKDAALEAAVGGLLSAGPATISAAVNSTKPKANAPDIRNSTVGSSASKINVHEGSNAPKANVAQNANMSDSGEDGLGAANLGFDPYSNLQNQTDKFHPEGPNAARPTDMPTTNAEGRNIPKSASTIYGAEGTTESGVKLLERDIANGKIAFDTITDKDSVSNAQRTIADKTFEGALEQYRQAVNSGVASKDNTTLGQQLLLQAMRDGNESATAELLTLYTRNSTTTAQALQAQSIFRKLSPEGQLVAVQKAIDAMNKKYGVEHTIDPADVKAFLEAKDENARKEAEKNIVKKAAQSVPGTFKAKFDTIRYLAMLGNARTHIRNVLGNTLFQIPVSAKNRVGALAEIGHNAFSENKVERTKSLLGANPFGALAKDAKADWANVKDFLSQNTKYNENRSTLKDIENVAHAFSDDTLLGKTINTLSDKNSDLLAAEDTAAKRIIYTQSLAGYLKANGCKRIADASPELLNRARTYASNEALRNTFNDTNALSSAVGKLNNLSNSDNKVTRAAGYVVEGVLPFKKTPANILVRAEEYSLVGAGVGIFNTIRGAAKGDTATISKGLDQLAAGATGTALMALGALAAGNGWVTGKEDDENQSGFDELTGHQSYALEMKDGTSVTLDWLAPEAIPFFVGVELYNAALDGNLPPKEFFAALKNSTAPMLEMSLLQSLNDTVENAAYAKFSGGSVLGSLVSSALTNYLTQVVPTLSGQLERSNEEERMTTYTDKNNDYLSTDMQYTLGKVSQKIPGWDYQQIPYIDAWGRTESTGDPIERAANNLFNPAYMSEVDVDNVEKELQRVYDAVGTEHGNPFPKRAGKSFEVNGKEKNLTADEYVKYAKAKGENSYKLAQQAMNAPAYNSMSDSEKAEFISTMYEYANYKAKQSIDSRYKSDSYKNYEEAEKQGITPAEYYVYHNATKDMKADKDKDGKSISGSKKEKVVEYIDNSDFSPTEKDWLYLLSFKSDNERTNQKNLRKLPWNQ